MADDTQTPDEPTERVDLVGIATKLEEEHSELAGWMQSLVAETTAINDAPEPLMATKNVKWPDGCDTNALRLKHAQAVELKGNQILAKAAALRTIAGYEPMIRDTQAIFEMPQYPELLGLKDYSRAQIDNVKAQLGFVAPPDPYLDPLFTAVKEQGGGRYSSDALFGILREASGARRGFSDTMGNTYQAQDLAPGFAVRNEFTDQYGVKALLTSLTGEAGIEPYAQQLDVLIEAALKRPTVFRLLPGATMTAKSYQFRVESAQTERYGYFNETASSRTAVGANQQSDVQVDIDDKTLVTAIGWNAATYEQLATEPMARTFFRRRLLAGFERWLDAEIVAGAGGTGKVESLKKLTPDSSSAAARGAFASGAGGKNNLYKKATSGESDLQAIFKSYTHMDDEDEGMSSPSVLGISPVGYEKMVNREISDADARWLFPSVLATAAPVTPFGLTIVKNKNLDDTEVLLLDPTHMLFRSHAQGITFEVDRQPKQLEEHVVLHLFFQMDVWRTQAVQRVTHLFS